MLARSFLAQHPGGRFTTLIVDAEEPASDADEGFEVLTPSQIGLSEREVNRMAMLYDVMEFATAVKPSLLKTLLARGAGAVTYFDPDIEIFRPLDDIDEVARRHSIVLTPHTLSPLPHDRRDPGERTLLLAGMFNLGFISVSDSADAFLTWWQERVARAGHVDPKRGEFVDQRWVDFVPSLFEHTALRDPTVNVAHWNLESRRITVGDDGYYVDGEPLRFFHFSGFDPDKPYLLSKFLGPEPKILLSSHPALARLTREYADKLIKAGYREATKETYGFGNLTNGTPITGPMRLVYRDALEEAERRADPEPPNPFVDGAQRFIAWLNEPAHPGSPTFTRYLSKLHEERAELRERFPDPRWADADSLLEWAWANVRSDRDLAAELVPDLDPVTTPPSPVAGGANVAGYFRAEAGVGQAGRHVLAGLDRAGIPYSSVVYAETPARQDHPFEESGGTAYDTNIVCVNADQLPKFAYDMGPDFFRGRYSIGLWWWEVSHFPSRFDDAFEIVDEIWVGSDFVGEAIRERTSKPVFTMPLGVEVPDERASLDRASLGLPSGFMFLFSFDFDGRFERKNPLGTVEAFRNAFAPGEGPILVIKTLNGDRWLTKLEQLRAATADRSDIFVIDRYLSASEADALTAACDCYVSLHRSEGFGLTIAEAMACGKPVIATAYSGNLEYMTAESSYFVPYGLIPIPDGVDPYPAGTEWAEPDLRTAAEHMRHVYEHPAEAATVGRWAREHIAQRLSPERTGEFISRRLEQIHRRPDAPLVAAGETSPSGIEQVERYLREGPSIPIRGPSRFGPIGRFGRRLVYRAIRPYTVRHSEFEHAVLEALRRAETNAVRAHVRQERMAETFETRLGETSAWIESVERQVRAIEQATTAGPFMANPNEFVTTNGDGDPVLGYSTRVEGGAAGSSFYRRFENVFRGPEQLISDRQSRYVEVVADHPPVLDVGCGRGEFLDLLRTAGVEARGIDLDEDMVAHCRAKGHEVEAAEATEYLASRPEGAFGAIFCAQVVEHMAYEQLLHFLELARSKLGPGGVLVFETVNPHSIAAFKTFWVDLTHEKPIFPEVALALCRLQGFDSAQVVFPNGTGDLETDRRSEGEYAVIATAVATAPSQAQ